MLQNKAPLLQQAQEKDKQFATTLASGIDILACFKVGEYSLGNKDFAQRTGLARNTVARLTYTLLELGYLRRAHNSKRYCLAPAILTLGYPLLASLQIRQLSRSLMSNLAREINGAVSLVMFDRLQMVYVETARFNHDLPTYPDIGKALPMLTTAAGRAFLAKSPVAERDVILNRIRLQSPDYYQANIDAAMHAMRLFQKEGFCASQAQWRPDVFGFAVPMSKTINGSQFVFNCGVSALDAPFHQRMAQVGPLLIELVRGVERMLGQ